MFMYVYDRIVHVCVGVCVCARAGHSLRTTVDNYFEGK